MKLFIVTDKAAPPLDVTDKAAPPLDVTDKEQFDQQHHSGLRASKLTAETFRVGHPRSGSKSDPGVSCGTEWCTHSWAFSNLAHQNKR